MELGTFWGIIETAQARSGPVTLFDQALAELLATRDVHDILEFHRRFEELHAALWRRDLRAAAYLIDGGCSDDNFYYFRSGLIGQGRDWFQQASADPDSLAGHPAVIAGPEFYPGQPLTYETVGYAAVRAYESRTGDEEGFYDALGPLPRAPEHDGQDPAGEDFDFDDAEEMRRRLPRLFAVCRARWS
jgi:hypothetical protein